MSADRRHRGDELEDLRGALESVVEMDRPAIGRLRYADTTVGFRVQGNEDQVTLQLDRRPPAVANGSEPAEVEIHLTGDQMSMFRRGALHLPSALSAGAVETSGPLRQYLEVDPILRGVLRELSETEDPPTSGIDSDARDDQFEMDADLLAIETRDLHKSFGANDVLNGVNLQVPEGVVSVVLGPSGTGKSVLLSHVIGLMRPDDGDVMVRGRSLGKMSRSDVLSLRLQVGVMFQDGALFSAMNLYDNVAFPLRQHTDLGEEAVQEIVMRHLASVGLSDAVDRTPGELSGGMKKRAGLARAMVLDPGIILCDEPDSGLDPVRTALLGDLLVEQHAEIGGTMLVITHNIALAREIGEHISVLWQGQIRESGSAEKIFDSDDEFIRQFLAGEVRGPLDMDDS